MYLHHSEVSVNTLLAGESPGRHKRHICHLVFSVSSRLQANNAGDYFPIWGTCQGFQQLTVLTANKNLLTLTDTKAVALPLTFTAGRPPRPRPRAVC